MQYALERCDGVDGNAYLKVFQTNANKPISQVGKVKLLDFPRDIVDLGIYKYLRCTNPYVPYPVTTSNSEKLEKHLIAIVGGLAGLGQDPWLDIIDVTQPEKPVSVARTSLGLGGTALSVKLAWAPPRLGLLVFGADSTNLTNSIIQVDLQLLLMVHSPLYYENLISYALDGIDLDGDGSYVELEAGEKPPMPAGSAPRIGLVNGGAVEAIALTAEDARTNKLVDFDMAVGGQYVVGVSQGSGSKPPRFWLLKAPGQTLNDSQSAVSSVDLPAEPIRVKLLLGQALDSDGLGALRDLALVSLRNGTLLVLDLRNRLNPSLANTVTIPASDGLPQSILVGGDGLLYLACANNMLVLDPRRLVSPQATLVIYRKSALGTNAHAFVAGDINHIASVSNNNAAFFGQSLPSPPQIVGLSVENTEKLANTSFRLDQLNAMITSGLTPSVSDLFGAALGQGPVSLGVQAVVPTYTATKRLSKDGLLEIVDPTSMSKAVTDRFGDFKPLMVLRANVSPTGVAMANDYPVWQKTKALTIAAPSTFAHGGLSQNIEFPPYPGLVELAIEQLAGQTVDIDGKTYQNGALEAFLGLAVLPTEDYIYYCEDKSVKVKIYSGIAVKGKFDVDFIKHKFEPLQNRINQFLKLDGSSVTLNMKGVLAFSGQWHELSTGNTAYYGMEVAAGLDPLIGLAGEFPVPLPGPLLPLTKYVPIQAFNTVGGSISVSFAGRRSEVPGRGVLWNFKGGTLGGKFTFGFLLKAVDDDPVVPWEVSLAADTGVSISGRMAPGSETDPTPKGAFKIRDFTLGFNGLTATAAIKFPGGKIIQKPVQIFPPREIFKADILLGGD
ncbi:MAG: hypothetical protein WCJ66_15090 [Verrucomicrobiota bacterium]